jgi:hypothetical protein
VLAETPDINLLIWEVPNERSNERANGRCEKQEGCVCVQLFAEYKQQGAGAGSLSGHVQRGF